MDINRIRHSAVMLRVHSLSMVDVTRQRQHDELTLRATDRQGL